MLAAPALQNQLSSNLMQLSAFFNSFRQSSTATNFPRPNGTKGPQKNTKVKRGNQRQETVFSLKMDSTKVRQMLASLQKQNDELTRLVTMVLSDSSQVPSETIWRRNHVSAPTFYENKTGFPENCLQPTTTERFLLLHRHQPRLLAAPSVYTQQQRTYIFNSEPTQTFGLGNRNQQQKDKESTKLLDKLSTEEAKKWEMKMLYRKIALNAALALFVAMLLFGFARVRTTGTFFGNAYSEIYPETVKERFSDVKGCDEALEELENVVEFLRNPDKFNAVGATFPKGFLLEGSPGVGKTLLAKAIAGEAGVPFFHSCGSDFDELYVGTGAAKVKKLFEVARLRAPCIIFIDEIDSIGGKRGSSQLHPYANQTINKLLQEIDGFSPQTGIIVIGATNRKNDLDEALLRSGRFDVTVKVMAPDFNGRKQLLELYLRRVITDGDIDLEDFAKRTFGMTGADIQNMVNQAAIQAAIQAEKITRQTLLEARDKVVMGPPWKNKFIDPKQKEMTAYHEAGHALVMYHTKASNPPSKITILARGHSLGHTEREADKENLDKSRAQLFADIDSFMGGRAAEELIFGKDKIGVGASSDFDKATRIATSMVRDYGMSEKIGNRVVLESKYESSHTRNLVDSEVDTILKESYNRAIKLIETHKTELHRVAEALLKYETITFEDFIDVIEGKPINPYVKPKKNEQKTDDIPDTIVLAPNSKPNPA